MDLREWRTKSEGSVLLRRLRGFFFFGRGSKTIGLMMASVTGRAEACCDFLLFECLSMSFLSFSSSTANGDLSAATGGVVWGPEVRIKSSGSGKIESGRE